MNTAGLELCKQLYELSGWDDGGLFHEEAYISGATVPLYDLGYLLPKLPVFSQLRLGTKGWCAYKHYADSKVILSNEPEDAVCKLCCELIRQGVLTS
jgi:hypothetical protein